VIKGGIYTIQTTQSLQGWHVHLHAVLEMQYVSVQYISKLWEECTEGDGKIVYIKIARMDTVLYILRYSLNASEVENVSDYLEATRSIRLFGSFGSCYRAASKEVDAEFEAETFSVNQVDKHCEFFVYVKKAGVWQNEAVCPACQKTLTLECQFDYPEHDLPPPPQSKSSNLFASSELYDYNYKHIRR